MRLFCIAITFAIAAPSPGLAAASGEHKVRTTDGIELWYRVAGVERSLPVLFLHGGPGEGSQVMQALAGPALEKRVRMVYLDQRGSGRSDRPKDPKYYSLELLASDVEQVRREVGADKIVLLAHSAGTPIALEYAADHPQHVAGIILTGAVPDLPAAIDGICERIKAKFPGRYPKFVAAARPGQICNPDAFESRAEREAFNDRNMFPDPLVRDRVNWLDNIPGVANNGALGGPLFSKGLLKYRFRRPEHITMPLLFLHGSSDLHTALAPQRALASKVRNGRVVIIPGGGHFAFADQPDRFAVEVAAFVRRLGR